MYTVYQYYASGTIAFPRRLLKSTKNSRQIFLTNQRIVFGIFRFQADVKSSPNSLISSL